MFVAQLPRLADVVKDGRGQQQVAIHPAVLLGHEVAHLGNGDRVLNQAPQIGVMVDLRRRSRQEGLHKFGIIEDPLEQSAVIGVVHRADVELQETLELVDIPIG